MPLPVDNKLGSCQIFAPIGAGGVGEVYKARDSKLNRDITITVLPAAFANDAQGTAGFEREARVLATVSSIHQGARVMELMQGADRHGPLPLDEVIPAARRIAEGLGEAHESGIIHRALKLVNVKPKPASVVKILDFCLAKTAGEPAR